MLDIPKFKSNPVPGRYLLTKILVLVVLGVLLYSGIYINYWLMVQGIPSVVSWIFIVAIVLLLILEILVSYIKYSRYEYIFYDNRIKIIEKKITTIDYDIIKQISFKENILDKPFHTVSIVLELNDGSKNILRNIQDINQIHFFLQKKISGD